MNVLFNHYQQKRQESTNSKHETGIKCIEFNIEEEDQIERKNFKVATSQSLDNIGVYIPKHDGSIKTISEESERFRKKLDQQRSTVKHTQASSDADCGPIPVREYRKTFMDDTDC